MLNEYVVLDIETTGLSRSRHRITEIAAVHVKKGKIVSEFQTLVNPGQPIPRFITRLTGIDDEMVRDAPLVDAVLPRLNSFLKNHIIVAHNASFDYGFLRHNFETYLNMELKNSKLCTRKLASRLLPELPSKKLSCLCEHFEIENADAHRAMSDVLATVKVFQEFHKMLESANIKKKADVLMFESLPIAKCFRLIEERR